MRKLLFHVIVPAGVISLLAAAGSAAAASAAPASSPAVATDDGDWCSFHMKADSLVDCGYSSSAECREKAGGKDAICIPDPDHAELDTRQKKLPV